MPEQSRPFGALTSGGRWPICDPNAKESGAGASVPGGKEREGYALIGIKGSSSLSSAAGKPKSVYKPQSYQQF